MFDRVIHEYRYNDIVKFIVFTDLLFLYVDAGPSQCVKQYYDVNSYADNDADFQAYQQRTKERGKRRYQIDF